MKSVLVWVTGVVETTIWFPLSLKVGDLTKLKYHGVDAALVEAVHVVGETTYFILS